MAWYMWLLMILGILILLGLAISRIRLGLELRSDGGPLILDMRIGPLKICLLPRPPARQKKAEQPAAAQEGGKKPSRKKPLPKPTWQELRTAAEVLLPPLRAALGRVRRGIRLDPLTLSLTLGGRSDPAAAAERYGRLHMAVWTGMPVLEQLICIPDPRIHLDLDFERESTVCTGTAALTLTLGTLLSVALRVGIPAIKLFIQFTKQHKHSDEQQAAASAA